MPITVHQTNTTTENADVSYAKRRKIKRYTDGGIKLVTDSAGGRYGYLSGFIRRVTQFDSETLQPKYSRLFSEMDITLAFEA